MGLVLKGSSNSVLKVIPYFNNDYAIGYKTIIHSNHLIDIINYSSNGFVGIGTEIPKERLELNNGIFKISNNLNEYSLQITNKNLYFNNSNNELIGLIGFSNNKDFINLYTTSNIKGFDINGELLVNEIRPENNKWHRTIDNNPRFYFSSNSTSYYESPNGYQWNNSNSQGFFYLTNTGKIGIGISTPITNLHISASNQFPLKISGISSNNSTFIAFNTDNYNWCKTAIGHIKTGAYDTGDLIFINRNTLDESNVDYNMDEKMRITNNGNIGIGIKNPTANLHINNSNLNENVMIKITNINNSNGLLLYKSSNNNSYIINNDETDLIIGNGKEAIKIDNSNNVTINNNIHINNDTKILIENTKSFFCYENSNIIIGKDIGWGTTPVFISGKLIFDSNFQINGSIISSNNINNNYVRLYNDSINSNAIIDTGNFQNKLIFTINSTEVMTIKANGNIGIGNNNPIMTGNDTNLCIGNSSMINSSGFLIIGRNIGAGFQRHFKLGYGDNNFITIGDFGTNNNPNIWKQQIRFHWNCPNNSFLIYENGDANLYGRLYQASDIKLKKNIYPIQNSLEKVNLLNGVEYSFINNDNNNKHIGLIAQDVEKIIPEVVSYNKNTDIKSVAYGNLTPLLINAIKELTQKVNLLEIELFKNRSHQV